MFLGTLSGPYFNHLIGSSSSGLTEMILTGERVASGIESGKIPMAFTSNAVNSQKGHRHQHVGAVLISGSASHRQQ